MSLKQQAKTLFAYMNGIHVGTLIREAQSRYIFTYEKDWLQRENTRPISLSMPLTETPFRGKIVYSFFDNLLPDSESIRNRVQVRFQTPTNRCFDLLSQIGQDCVGSLQLLTEPLSMDIQKIQAEPKDNKTIAKWLMDYRASPLGMDKNTDFRISLAGAQEKTALLWYKNKWHEPISATPTSHIIKLPIGHIEHSGVDLSESVENEWICLQILSAFGLPVNKAKITNFEKVKTLVVERFDRQWSKDKKWLMRLPQEDMCQALGKSSRLKYESDGGPGIVDIMDLLRGAYDAKRYREQFMKSIFLFWVLGAMDGHAKNFSIFIDPGGRYRLTPLYDVISYYPMAEKHQISWKSLKMAMALKSKNCHYKWESIQLRHWFSTAEQCHFPAQTMQSVIEEVCDSLEAVIDKTTKILPTDFPGQIADSIFGGMRRVKNKCE